MTQNETLSPKQQRTIQALLTNPTLTSAATAAKISRSTLGRWLEDTRFNQALLQAEAASMTDTTRALLAGKETALATLGELMTGASSDNVRRQAACDWLNFTNKGYELQTLDQRISALEGAHKQKE